MIAPCGLALVVLLAGSGIAPASPIYVASQGAGTMVALDSGSAPPGAPLPVARTPAQIAAGPEGRLYLTHPDTRQITVVDGRAGSVLRTLSVPGQPFGLAVSRDGSSLFVGDWSGNRVIRVSAETGTVAGEVAVGKDPAALVLDRSGRLYVADRESRQVSVIDTTRMARIATVPVGEAPFALALDPAEERLYVANVRDGTVSVVATADTRTIATLKVGGMPYGVAVSEDGGRLLVSNQQGGTLVVLDARAGTVQAVVPVGRYPEGVATAGKRAYVANWFSDSVSVIDLDTLRETARITVPEGPRSLVIPQEVAR